MIKIETFNIVLIKPIGQALGPYTTVKQALFGIFHIIETLNQVFGICWIVLSCK